METRLSFCYKSDTRPSLFRVGNTSSFDSGLSHLGLFWPSPSIGMRQDEHNITFEGRPQRFPMGILDVALGTLMKVPHVVSEDLHDGLSRRKRRDRLRT